MARVVVAATDFFFNSKIKQAALHANVETAFVDSKASLLAEAARPETQLVIVDLNGEAIDAVDAVRALKAGKATAHVETVGYLSHVMVGLRKEAEAAGCDRVLPRSAFVKLLPELLKGAGR